MAERTELSKSDGPAAAAVFAAGLGVFLIGLLTTLAEASKVLKAALAWYGPAGPLTGKTGAGVIAWLVIWVILHILWREREVNFDRFFIVSMVLVAVGWILTFPIVFEAFGQ